MPRTPVIALAILFATDAPAQAPARTETAEADGSSRSAILLLSLDAAAHPRSARALANLGAAYEHNGQLRWARASYARAIEWAPAGDAADEYLAAQERLTREIESAAEKAQGEKREAHVMRILEVGPGDVVADVGCGSGWLSKAACKVVGSTGKVYAVELSERRMKQLRHSGFANLIPVHSVPEDASLPDGAIDVVFLHDVASHVEKKVRPAFYASVGRALRPDGRLVVFKHHGGAAKLIEELRGFGFVVEEGEDLKDTTGKSLDARAKAGIRFRYRPVRRL